MLICIIILIWIVQIFGWTPEPYTKEAIEKNEMEMPEDLKMAILNLNNTLMVNN